MGPRFAGQLDDDGEILHWQVTLKLGFRME
jgi:flavin-binding protein dodecin